MSVTYEHRKLAAQKCVLRGGKKWGRWAVLVGNCFKFKTKVSELFCGFFILHGRHKRRGDFSMELPLGTDSVWKMKLTSNKFTVILVLCIMHSCYRHSAFFHLPDEHYWTLGGSCPSAPDCEPHFPVGGTKAAAGFSKDSLTSVSQPSSCKERPKCFWL